MVMLYVILPSIAACTSKWFFSCVWFHVHIEFTFNSESFITYSTLEGFFSGVTSNMFSKMWRVVKSKTGNDQSNRKTIKIKRTFSHNIYIQKVFHRYVSSCEFLNLHFSYNSCHNEYMWIVFLLFPDYHNHLIMGFVV